MKIDIEKLLNYAKGLANAKILVVGDLALDEMVYGDTERISREAPVLILRHSHTNLILGAASNAAHNVATINGGKIGVVGIIGDDYQANNLKDAFESVGVDCSNLVVDKTRPTVTKTRISGSCFQSITQQIVRIDRQSSEPISKEIEDKIIERLEKAIPLYDGVILSDYHIGTLTGRVISKAIELCKKENKKIIVDGQKDLQRYKGVTSMTPNLPDTQKHVGFFIKNKEDLHKAGKKLIQDTDAPYVLVTCGEEGMALITKEGKMTRVPVFNKSKVFDVTGAGDTVTALYSLALVSGAEPVYSAILGNIAAGIVIKQYGCATTTINELVNFIEQNRRKLENIELMEGMRSTASKQIESKSPIEFEVFLRSVTISAKECPVKTGDTTFISIRNVPYTDLEVIDVKYVPKKAAVSTKNGYIAVNDPAFLDTYDIIVKVRDEALVTKDGAVVGGNKIKMGLPITLEGKTYKFTGSVSNLNIIDSVEK